MKSYFHTCPLVVLTILSSLAVACSAEVQQLLFPPVSAEETKTSVSEAAAPSSSSGAAASSAAPSSAPPSSVFSSRNPVSSAQSKTPPAPKKETVSAVHPKQPLFRTVDRSYFSDALFVGDSLTEDLKKYGGLDNASYFYHVGLSIYQLFEKPKPDAFSGLTFEKALRNRRYKKIYVLLGINEMGTGNTAYFVRHYSAALAEIRKLQPDAVLYVESILPVTAEKSERDPTFNNPRIRERNAGLKTLANGKNIFYFDIASALEDSSGNLPKEYSGDDVHLKAKYYPLWTDFLLKNAVPYSDVSFS